MALKDSFASILGVICIVVGVGVLVYNLLGYEPFVLSHWALRYDDPARIGVALGAVILTSGIFLYKSGQKK